ncbi:aldo/keto reductase [Paracoccaceae bacterium GXU_MW_L88]
MKMNTLGRTDIDVSAICLGTMTWGVNSQNDEAEAHRQLSRAVEAGVNFIDTAEMYPTTPHSKEGQGSTEKFIGTWLKDQKREDLVVATKIAGEGSRYIRDGAPISPEAIDDALHTSLKSLQTDYVDLYQLHWPNRGSYCFRQNWDYTPSNQPPTAQVEDEMRAILESLKGYVKEGKIRHIGLSNETAWGTMRWLQLAKELDAPRMESIQNEYSLLARLYDTDLAEMTAHEDVGLLAYSPLAAGLLTGKYAGGAIPKGARADVGSKTLGGRMTDRVHDAVAAYQAIADKHGLDLVQMSLAFCMQRPFVTSTIIGATSGEQLETCLGAADVTLSEEVLDEINTTHKQHPMPY